MDREPKIAGGIDEGALRAALRGERIYGDDFGPAQIEAWYEDEREGYANLYGEERGEAYPYHAQNVAHGYSKLPEGRRFRHALGFGAAYGEELRPVLSRVDRVTIVDPSDKFAVGEVAGVPAAWVKPRPSGLLPFEDGAFDLVTCFGVLHHIPNVTTVVRELARVLAPDGYLLVREPIVSMGDWRRPRHGLTKRERGLPLALFEGALAGAGLEVVARTLCMFPPFLKACQRVGVGALNSPAAIRADAALSRLFRWNYAYHPSWTGKKFTPTSAFLVVGKAARTAGAR